MRVAVLGSFPIYPFRKQLEIPDFEKRRESLWHIPLAEGLGCLEDIELHTIATTDVISQDKRFIYNNIQMHYLRVPRYSRIGTLLQLHKMKISKELSKIKPNIVHGHSTEHGYPYIAVSSGFPNVVTCHNIVAKLVRENNLIRGLSRSSIRWGVLYLFEKYTLRKAKHIIVASPYMKEALKPYTSGHIHVVTHSSIDNEFFESVLQQKERDHLLFIGDIRPEKGLLTLLKAMKIVVSEYGQLVLNIVGPKVSDYIDYYSQLDKFVQDNNLSRNVYFVGYKGRSAIIQELYKAAMLILPSSYEPLGLVLGEAMAVGIPVVATKVGGIPHVVRDGETGFLVEPGNVAALADKIMTLLKDKELRRKMGEKGRQETRRRFHPKVVAKKIRAVYEKVLSDWRAK